MAGKLKLTRTLEDELNTLYKENPTPAVVMALRGLVTFREAFGTTRDIRQSASYYQAKKVYFDVTGTEWSGA